MKVLNPILLAGAAILTSIPFAHAADLPTRKELPPAPPKINYFQDFWTYMNSSPADCPLSAAGVTVYGQIDVGAGYETNASKLDKWAPQGVSELISSTSHGSRLQLVPSGPSQFNRGASDAFFVGDVDFGFDPYTLHFAHGPRLDMGASDRSSGSRVSAIRLLAVSAAGWRPFKIATTTPEACAHALSRRDRPQRRGLPRRPPSAARGIRKSSVCVPSKVYWP